MTVNIDSANTFEMTVNTPNVSAIGTVIEVVSQHSNDTLFRLDVDIVETNDRYTTVTCDLPTDFYKEHYNGIYEYSLETNGEVVADVDFVDIENIEFLGIKIDNGYTEFKKFKSQMNEMGIDVDELINEECVGLITTGDIQKLKNEYRDLVK